MPRSRRRSSPRAAPGRADADTDTARRRWLSPFRHRRASRKPCLKLRKRGPGRDLLDLAQQEMRKRKPLERGARLELAMELVGDMTGLDHL